MNVEARRAVMLERLDGLPRDELLIATETAVIEARDAAIEASPNCRDQIWLEADLQMAVVRHTILAKDNPHEVLHTTLRALLTLLVTTTLSTADIVNDPILPKRVVKHLKRMLRTTRGTP